MTDNNPDVLLCLANLSSDEVFTPPKIANEMLDMLPQNLFTNPDTKFLDPACKSGVFLREITKRLIDGLEPKIPDLHARINHILREQVFGIAITDLTALISRRTVYCTMNPDNNLSVCKFDDPVGNIIYNNHQHSYNNRGRCTFCGASEKNFTRSEDSETHTYEFIHTLRPERIFSMNFDVVISNPPYQLNNGGGMGSSAIPIYHKFVEQAKKLNPRYITMIIPARWYSGGRGLDEFRDEMLHDEHIKELHDFPDASDCFNGVEIKGGVCYFLWDKRYKGKCTVVAHKNNTMAKPITRPLVEADIGTFIRYNEAISTIHKVKDFHEESFIKLVNANDPFGYDIREANSYKRVKPNIQLTPFDNSVKMYYFGWQKNGIGYIDKATVGKNKEFVDKYKVLISKAAGTGKLPDQVLNRPFIAYQ